MKLYDSNSSLKIKKKKYKDEKEMFGELKCYQALVVAVFSSFFLFAFFHFFSACPFFFLHAIKSTGISCDHRFVFFFLTFYQSLKRREKSFEWFPDCIFGGFCGSTSDISQRFPYGWAGMPSDNTKKRKGNKKENMKRMKI